MDSICGALLAANRPLYMLQLSPDFKELRGVAALDLMYVKEVGTQSRCITLGRKSPTCCAMTGCEHCKLLKEVYHWLLLCSVQDIILPHEMTFYDLIVTKVRCLHLGQTLLCHCIWVTSS